MCDRPYFREGQQSRSSTAPIEIPLPDDPMLSMWVICRNLHFRAQEVTITDSHSSTYPALYAVTVDKYDLSEPLQFYTNVILRKWLQSFSGDTGSLPAMTVALAAYVLNEKEIFTAATAALVGSKYEPLSACYSIDGVPGGLDMSMLPLVLPGKLIQYFRRSLIS